MGGGGQHTTNSALEIGLLEVIHGKVTKAEKWFGGQRWLETEKSAWSGLNLSMGANQRSVASRERKAVP